MNRFQIEDLIAQDASGVVFRALDTETNLPVTVRRFFPFGADGGGLNPEEQAAYDMAVARLSQVSHPALRTVICGGCDPVDGMPYLATEWIDGPSLVDIIATGDLTEASGAAIITKALEVCELLSEVFAEEAVWIDTDAKTFIAGPEGREITFWISPLKWLGRNETQRGMDAIVRLATGIMGWRGKASNELPQGGFAKWLNWLRASAGTATLCDARTRLATCMAGEASPVSRATVRPPARPAKAVVKKKKSKLSTVLMSILMSLLLLAALGVGGWQFLRWHSAKYVEKVSAMDLPKIVKQGGSKAKTATKPKVAAEPKATTEPKVADQPKTTTEPKVAADTERSPEEATRRLQELSEQAAKSSAEKEADATRVKTEISKRGGVFTPADSTLLIALKNTSQALEGTLKEVKPSGTGKTVYLLFSENDGDARGSIIVSKAKADLTAEYVTQYVGKKIRLRGTVNVQNNFGVNRSEIMIFDRKAIEEVK